ncbi:hypothetical protein BC829DRAFT_422831 [Chytridium lagenaria]|nr:hypothetical protein BC829DRAFT_422831 [Chytridium lagenaria]
MLRTHVAEIKLQDLDKSWRTSRPEDRERIALEFSNFFQDFKGSFHANAARGLLSGGNNLLRQSVVKVFQLNAGAVHLKMEKESLLFGELSHVVYQVTEVQHSVIHFFTSRYGKTSIEYENKRDRVPSRIVRLLKHTYKNDMAANMAREMAVAVLKTGPSVKVFVALLQALTELCVKFPFHMSEQIQLLSDTFSTNTHQVIRTTALKDLLLLSRHPFHFQLSHLKMLLLRIIKNLLGRAGLARMIIWDSQGLKEMERDAVVGMLRMGVIAGDGMWVVKIGGACEDVEVGKLREEDLNAIMTCCHAYLEKENRLPGLLKRLLALPTPFQTHILSDSFVSAILKPSMLIHFRPSMVKGSVATFLINRITFTQYREWFQQKHDGLVMEKKDGWLLYRCARSALCGGNFGFARLCLDVVGERVTTEIPVLWGQALSYFTEGMLRIRKEDSISSVSVQRAFQEGFLEALIEVLDVVVEVRKRVGRSYEEVGPCFGEWGRGRGWGGLGRGLGSLGEDLNAFIEFWWVSSDMDVVESREEPDVAISAQTQRVTEEIAPWKVKVNRILDLLVAWVGRIRVPRFFFKTKSAVVVEVEVDPLWKEAKSVKAKSRIPFRVLGCVKGLDGVKNPQGLQSNYSIHMTVHLDFHDGGPPTQLESLCRGIEDGAFEMVCHVVVPDVVETRSGTCVFGFWVGDEDGGRWETGPVVKMEMVVVPYFN